jgi:sRNA-binding carbon storage regulator CsrA
MSNKGCSNPNGGLCLGRHLNESIIIGAVRFHDFGDGRGEQMVAIGQPQIRITVVRTAGPGGQVRLAISAPREFAIVREELLEQQADEADRAFDQPVRQRRAVR